MRKTRQPSPIIADSQYLEVVDIGLPSVAPVSVEVLHAWDPILRSSDVKRAMPLLSCFPRSDPQQDKLKVRVQCFLADT